MLKESTASLNGASIEEAVAYKGVGPSALLLAAVLVPVYLPVHCSKVTNHT